jgi:hypothetical protein
MVLYWSLIQGGKKILILYQNAFYVWSIGTVNSVVRASKAPKFASALGPGLLEDFHLIVVRRFACPAMTRGAMLAGVVARGWDTHVRQVEGRESDKVAVHNER